MCSGNRFSYTALVRQIRRLYLAQPDEHAIARGLRACSQEYFKITCSEIDSEGISYILLYIGIILTLPYTKLLPIAICSFIITSTSVATCVTFTDSNNSLGSDAVIQK